MSSDYDEEDVVWGPLSLREIKNYFKNSIHENKIKKMSNKDDFNPNLYSIPGSSSDYYTPNQTVNKENELCLPSAGCSVYASCTEGSNPNNSLENTDIHFQNMVANRDTVFDLGNVQQTLVECTVDNGLCVDSKSFDNLADSSIKMINSSKDEDDASEIVRQMCKYKKI